MGYQNVPCRGRKGDGGDWYYNAFPNPMMTTGESERLMGENLEVRTLYTLHAQAIPHVGRAVTCGHRVTYRATDIWQTVVDYLATLLQKVLATLERHVTAVLIGLDVWLEWLHQPMLDLSKQSLLFPPDDVEVCKEMS